MSDATMSDAGRLFREGKIAEAVAAANAAVRLAPADVAARLLLAELLLFAGNPERADVILDAAGDLDPGAGLVIAEFRQLLRADLARRQLRRDGRLPEFVAPPSPALTASLAAAVALRGGDLPEAARQADLAETLRPRVPGLSGATRFDDFRDVDDLCCGFFEVLTTTGKYFWVPTELVDQVVFHPPKRPRDLFWRRASMTVRAGPDGDVYLPVLYGDEAAQADEVRLGRATDWVQQDQGPVRGVGQRLYLAGDEALAIMDLGELTFDPPAAADPPAVA